MNNLARKQSPHAVSQETGKVLRREGAESIVRTGRGDFWARTAASCLLTPEAGDEVLLCVLEPQGCYILAVLERGGESEARVSLPGDLTLELPHGQLTVSAARGLNLSTPAALGLSAAELTLTAAETSVLSRQVNLVGTLLRAELHEIKALAQTCDSLFERAVQRVKSAYRFVTDTEHVRAARLDYAAEESLRLHGRDTLLTAERLIKADGEQIHLG